MTSVLPSRSFGTEPKGSLPTVRAARTDACTEDKHTNTAHQQFYGVAILGALVVPTPSVSVPPDQTKHLSVYSVPTLAISETKNIIGVTKRFFSRGQHQDLPVDLSIDLLGVRSGDTALQSFFWIPSLKIKDSCSASR